MNFKPSSKTIIDQQSKLKAKSLIIRQFNIQKPYDARINSLQVGPNNQSKQFNKEGGEFGKQPGFQFQVKQFEVSTEQQDQDFEILEQHCCQQVQRKETMDNSTACLVKAYLRENSNTKIKLCIVGAGKSGKTSLINAYLKYREQILQNMLVISDGSNSNKSGRTSFENQDNVLKSLNSSTSNLTLQIKQKLREIARFNKTPSVSEKSPIWLGQAGVNRNKTIQNLDIEPVLYLYDEEYPIEVQLWDQVVGQSKDEYSNYFFSQSYLQGKNGVIFLVNPEKPGNTTGATEQTIKNVGERLGQLKDNCSVPVLPVFNKQDLIVPGGKEGTTTNDQTLLLKWSEQQQDKLIKKLAFTQSNRLNTNSTLDEEMNSDLGQILDKFIKECIEWQVLDKLQKSQDLQDLVVKIKQNDSQQLSESQKLRQSESSSASQALFGAHNFPMSNRNEALLQNITKLMQENMMNPQIDINNLSHAQQMDLVMKEAKLLMKKQDTQSGVKENEDFFNLRRTIHQQMISRSRGESFRLNKKKLSQKRSKQKCC